MLKSFSFFWTTLRNIKIIFDQQWKSPRSFVLIFYYYNLYTHLPNRLQSRFLKNRHALSIASAFVGNYYEILFSYLSKLSRGVCFEFFVSHRIMFVVFYSATFSGYKTWELAKNDCCQKRTFSLSARVWSFKIWNQ